VYILFLVYLLISTCLGPLCAHHQEEQLFLCDTWYLLFWNKWTVQNYRGVCHKTSPFSSKHDQTFCTQTHTHKPKTSHL